MHHVLRISITLATVMFLALIGPAPRPAQAAALGALNLVFDPAPMVLGGVGEMGIVTLRLDGAVDLAAYELDLMFDPQVIAIEHIERLVGTADYPSPHREWEAVPIDPGGYVTTGPGTIAFGAYSYGANNPAGLRGDILLARLHVRAVGPGITTLQVANLTVLDTWAQKSTATSSTGVIRVQSSWRGQRVQNHPALDHRR